MSAVKSSQSSMCYTAMWLHFVRRNTLLAPCLPLFLGALCTHAELSSKPMQPPVNVRLKSRQVSLYRKTQSCSNSSHECPMLLLCATHKVGCASQRHLFVRFWFTQMASKLQTNDGHTFIIPNEIVRISSLL